MNGNATLGDRGVLVRRVGPETLAVMCEVAPGSRQDATLSLLRWTQHGFQRVSQIRGPGIEGVAINERGAFLCGAVHPAPNERFAPIGGPSANTSRSGRLDRVDLLCWPKSRIVVLSWRVEATSSWSLSFRPTLHILPPPNSGDCMAGPSRSVGMKTWVRWLAIFAAAVADRFSTVKRHRQVWDNSPLSTLMDERSGITNSLAYREHLRSGIRVV